FFPPNTTSKLQPLDQGVIKSFKCYYRQQLVKHVISRCTVATSTDEIFITVMDAVYWINDAWKSVTQSTINNAFKVAGFIHTNNQVTTDDLSILKINHINIGGQRFSANEFIEIDTNIPVFNEWKDIDNHSIIVNDESENKTKTNHYDEDDDIPAETPPQLIEVLEMVKRLHLFAAIQQPQLHTVISRLDSQLTQLYIDSKGTKQTKIDDSFHKN
ncbi:unnamed protein product, partial [Rotaria magnacalcarata]